MTIMPVEFALFNEQAKSNNYQNAVEQTANLFALWTRNKVKVEIKVTKSLSSYVAGFGLGPTAKEALREEIELRGMKIVKANVSALYIEFTSDIMSGFWALVGMIENVESLVREAKQRQAVRKFCDRSKETASVYGYAAAHIRNCLAFNQPQMISRCGGLFDDIDSLITMGYSVQARVDQKLGLSVWREHVVPCDFMLVEAVRMIKEGATDQEVSVMLAANNKIVIISTSQAAHLDGSLGLRTNMPQGWQFGDSVLARLTFAQIELE